MKLKETEAYAVDYYAHCPDCNNIIDEEGWQSNFRKLTKEEEDIVSNDNEVWGCRYCNSLFRINSR